MNGKIDPNSINKLFFSKKTSDQALIEAFKELKPDKKHILINLIFFLLSGFIAIRNSLSIDTITYFINGIELINGVILALFAIIFSGYVFFQALLNKNVLLRFLEKYKDDMTYLQMTNEYFLNIMLLYVFSILINLCCLLIIKNISPYAALPLPNIINEILSTIFLTIYYYYHFALIWETKSFVFNIYRLLYINAIEQAIEKLNEKK